MMAEWALAGKYTRVHACIRKLQIRKSIQCADTNTHTLAPTTQHCDLNLKFRARLDGSDALYVEAVMSTCCTRFLHFCLLFFINYAILRLNVLDAHDNAGQTRATTSTKNSKRVITRLDFHMNVLHH